MIEMLMPAAIIVFVLLAIRVIVSRRTRITMSEMITQRLRTTTHRPPPPMPDEPKHIEPLTPWPKK